MPRDGRETPAELAQLDHRGRERALLLLAARQEGVVSLQQLLALGFSAQAVRDRVARGRLHRLHRGVYAVGRPDVPAKGRRLAAVLACGAGAVLSHLSAAAHHGLRQSSATRLEVTIPRRSSLRRPGIRVHRSLCLTDADAAAVDSVPCTSIARTLLDVATRLDARGLERAVEQAHILEVYDHRAVVSVLERAPGQPGVRRLREVLGIARPGETRTKSDLEDDLLALCRRRGLPQPGVNAWILLGGEHAQVDFLWRQERVVVEVDGYKYHRGRGAFGRDRRRDQLLQVEGWGHARFADVQVVAAADHVVDVIERLLAPPAARPPAMVEKRQPS